MRRLVLVLGTVLLALPACGKQGSGKHGPVGTWVVDTQRFVADYAAAMKQKQNGKEATQAELGKVRDSVHVTFKIKNDGTWTITGSMMGSDLDEAGTWKQDGEHLKVTITTQDGEPRTPPDTVTASFHDDGIAMRTSKHSPFDLHMVRK